MKKILKIFMCLSLALILSLFLVACSDEAEETKGGTSDTKSQDKDTKVQVDEEIKETVANYVKDYYNGIELKATLPDGVFLPGKDLIDDVASIKDDEKNKTIKSKIAEKSSIEFVNSDVSEDNVKVEVKISFSYDMTMIQTAMDNVSKENKEDITTNEIISKCFDDIIKAIETPGDNPTIEQVQIKFVLENKPVETNNETGIVTDNGDKGEDSGAEPKDVKNWVVTKIEK